MACDAKQLQSQKNKSLFSSSHSVDHMIYIWEIVIESSVIPLELGQF